MLFEEENEGKEKKDKKGIRERTIGREIEKTKWMRVLTLPQLNLRGPGIPAPLVALQKILFGFPKRFIEINFVSV